MIACGFDTSDRARYGEVGPHVRRADDFPTDLDGVTIIACKVTDRPTWWDALPAGSQRLRRWRETESLDPGGG